MVGIICSSGLTGAVVGIIWGGGLTDAVLMGLYMYLSPLVLKAVYVSS